VKLSSLSQIGNTHTLSLAHIPLLPCSLLYHTLSSSNFRSQHFFLSSSRGLISHVETTPTAGTISVDPSRQALVWTIGQRFTARNHEVALPAAVFFDTSKTSVSSSAATSASFRGSIAPPSHSSSSMKGIDDDPFLVSQNCYVKVIKILLVLSTSPPLQFFPLFLPLSLILALSRSLSLSSLFYSFPSRFLTTPSVA
jgi:hypothetical protein